MKLPSEQLSMRTSMVYIPPPHTPAVLTNRTNAYRNINLIFVFIGKTGIIMGISTMGRPSGMESYSSEYSGCSLYLGLGENPQSS